MGKVDFGIHGIAELGVASWLKPVLHGLAAASLALCTAGTAAAQPPAGVGGQLRIDVGDHQHVTMIGSSDSLRDAIQQLCVAAGVKLRAYDAEDRPFSAHYEDIALDQLLARLLRPESYMVGLRAAGEGKPEIAWLRVIGEGGPAPPLPQVTPLVRATGAASRTDDDDFGSGPASQLGVSAEAFESAMSNRTYEKRRRATDAILAKLRKDPSLLDGFLARPPDQIAAEIGQYPYAMYLIMHIQQLPLKDQKDATGVVKQKLSALVHAIRQVKNGG